jgi:hypothetical protein
MRPVPLQPQGWVRPVDRSRSAHSRWLHERLFEVKPSETGFQNWAQRLEGKVPKAWLSLAPGMLSTGLVHAGNIAPVVPSKHAPFVADRAASGFRIRSMSLPRCISRRFAVF